MFVEEGHVDNWLTNKEPRTQLLVHYDQEPRMQSPRTEASIDKGLNGHDDRNHRLQAIYVTRGIGSGRNALMPTTAGLSYIDCSTESHRDTAIHSPVILRRCSIEIETGGQGLARHCSVSRTMAAHLDFDIPVTSTRPRCAGSNKESSGYLVPIRIKAVL